MLGFCFELLCAAKQRRGGDFTPAPVGRMQPVRYVGFSVCTWEVSLDDGPLIYPRIKNVGEVRSTSLTQADLCSLWWVGREGWHSSAGWGGAPGKQSRAGLHCCSQLRMPDFPTMASHLPPPPESCFALQAAPVAPVSAGDWLWAACSQRRYFHSLHCPRVWPVLPSLQLSLLSVPGMWNPEPLLTCTWQFVSVSLQLEGQWGLCALIADPLKCWLFQLLEFFINIKSLHKWSCTTSTKHKRGEVKLKMRYIGLQSTKINTYLSWSLNE